MQYNVDADLAFAIHLQQQFDKEYGEKNNQKPVFHSGSSTSSECYNIVDDTLELIDPTPDVIELFREYDKIYFSGKLQCCEVKWSSRMTLCAGMCYYEGHGGLCSIRLSAPLLKLRPRKDLVETLLHEMIHAYLFVTRNYKDHTSHGPEFLKHMYRINKHSGANITVYHNFHDEVDLYRKHWWQCNGPCKNWAPYYGLVKRSINRAPGPNDGWWKEHQKTCTGVFTKISPTTDDTNKKRKIGPETAAHASSSKENGRTINDYFQPFAGLGHVLGSLSSSSKPFNKSTLPGSTTGSNFCEKWTINTSDSNRAPVRHNQSHITEQLHSPQQQRKKQRVDNYFIKNPPKSSHFPFNFLGTSSSSFVTGFNIFTNFWTADDDDVRIIGGATGNTQSWYPNSSSS